MASAVRRKCLFTVVALKLPHRKKSSSSNKSTKSSLKNIINHSLQACKRSHTRQGFLYSQPLCTKRKCSQVETSCLSPRTETIPQRKRSQEVLQEPGEEQRSEGSGPPGTRDLVTGPKCFIQIHIQTSVWCEEIKFDQKKKKKWNKKFVSLC